MKHKKRTKLAEWQLRAKSGNEKCKCGETRNLNVDHIVPVSILSQFIVDRDYLLYEMEENFEIVCRYCNHMKADRLDPKNPKTYLILERAINRTKDYYFPLMNDHA